MLFDNILMQIVKWMTIFNFFYEIKLFVNYLYI